MKNKFNHLITSMLKATKAKDNVLIVKNPTSLPAIKTFNILKLNITSCWSGTLRPG